MDVPKITRHRLNVKRQILPLLLWITLLPAAATGNAESLHGWVYLIAGTTGSRMALQCEFESFIAMQASTPLPLDIENPIDSLRMTGRVTIGSFKVDLGKIDMTHAAGFVLSNEKGSSHPEELLSVRSLGRASDPLGIVCAGARWSFFAMKDTSGPIAGVQLVAASMKRMNVLISAGFLTPVHAWTAIALRHADTRHGWEAIFHAAAEDMPVFSSDGASWIDTDGFSFDQLIKGIAFRGSIWTRGKKGSFEAACMGETGHVRDPLGRVSSSDACLSVKLQPAVSYPMQSLYGTLVLSSRQGSAVPMNRALPAWGVFPHPWMLRYSLDDYKLEAGGSSSWFSFPTVASSIQLKSKGSFSCHGHNRTISFTFDCGFRPLAVRAPAARVGISVNFSMRFADRWVLNQALLQACDSIEGEEGSNSESNDVVTEEAFPACQPDGEQPSQDRREYQVALYAMWKDAFFRTRATVDEYAPYMLQELSVDAGLSWKSSRFSLHAAVRPAEDRFFDSGSVSLALSVSF